MKKTLSALALSALPTFALATMSNAPSTDDQLGSPIEASRTIKHAMLANMQLISSEISMQAGDTVRFSIGNSGKISNDMFLNTPLSERAHINRWTQSLKNDSWPPTANDEAASRCLG